MAVPQICPLCKADAAKQSVVTSHVYGKSERRAIFLCETCDLRYLHPSLSVEEEAAFYAKEFEKFMTDRSASNAGWEQPERHISANQGERTRRMGHLAPLIAGGAKRILEVGCSSGFMLYPLVEAGHHCVGVEPSGVFSDYVRSRGLTCYRGCDELPIDESFDLILHYYVLEHVADPVEFLRAQRARLRPGGILLFEVPSATDALSSFRCFSS